MMLAAPETTAYQAMAATFAPANWNDDVITVPVLGIYADHSASDDPVYFKKIFPNGVCDYTLPGVDQSPTDGIWQFF